MRILLILTFVVFSLGAMATFESPDNASETSGPKDIYAQAGTLTGAVAIVRKVKSHLSTDQAWSGPSASNADGARTKVGDVVPETFDLYEIPRHESYRYTIVEGQRVIVDAASRQIVYILR
ncbi:DUF1236 domain-containing protein [Microvirga pakistanensis]|uniref:DUF1236 domain-containing protein n=1 Tax=Microvirga pakistanensis TaxID=1682650 RepID=UPI00106AC924|nr:DUF1236 domain-containing protein [Microvirga pakistanensis]